MLKSFLSVFTHAEKKISNNFIWEHKTHRSTRIYEAYPSRVVSFVSLSSERITKAPSAMVVFKSLIPVCFLSCFIQSEALTGIAKFTRIRDFCRVNSLVYLLIF